MADSAFGWFASVQNQFGISAFLAIIISSAIALVVFRKRKENGENLPPGPFNLPIVGHLPFLGKEPFRGLHKLAKKYGNVFALYLGKDYCVILGDYEAVKDGFRKSTTTDRPEHILDFVPDGVGFSSMNGQEWIEQRQYCVKSMSLLGIGRDGWETDVQAEVEDFVQKIAMYDGRPHDFSRLLGGSIANNISSFVFGSRLPWTEKNILFLNDCMDSAVQFAANVGLRNSFPILASILIALGLTDYAKYKNKMLKFNKFVREQVELHKKNSIKENPDNFIDGYLMKIRENEEKHLGNSFNHTNLYGNIQTLFIGSSYTTKISLAWLFLKMASDMKIQQKVHEEIDSVLGKEGKIKWSERRILPYTYAVIMEGQRWRTAVPVDTARRAMEDIKICEYDVPKGTIIFANIWGLHNDTKYWNDPEKFVPERFLLEDGKKVNYKPESYVPFSIGKRNCPGEVIAMKELLFYFVAIMQQFTVLTPMGKVPKMHGDLGMGYHPVSQELRFVRRE